MNRASSYTNSPGISEGLHKSLAEFHEGNTELIINVDGLPLTKSGKICFWPILCQIFYKSDIYRLFVVAIYCGVSKPNSLSSFFKEFIIELNDLQARGFISHGKTFNVQLKAIVADTPARAFCQQTKGHGGYSACERCTVYGVAVKAAGKKTNCLSWSRSQKKNEHLISRKVRSRPSCGKFSMGIDQTRN